MISETCDQCHFDSDRYTIEDAAGTLGSLAPRWRRLTHGVERAVLARRPEPATWSAVEYAAHSRDVTALMAAALEAVLAQDRPRFRAPAAKHAAPGDADPGLDLDAVLAELAGHADQLERRARQLPGDAWSRQADVDGEVIDAGWLLRHAVHDASHHLSDVGRGLHRLGAGARSAMGAVVQLNSSDGGVPKRAVAAVDVTVGGVVGDRQAVRRHHGRMWQALCLWSQDVIASLQAEGHPIAAGSAGENVTVSGLDWSTIRPGVRLRVGSVLAEVSDYADPCAANGRWFIDRNFMRIDPERHPGSSRVYASVMEPGRITSGDAVIVEPTDGDRAAGAARG
jgi:MOSC domain-containing protein YiiM